MCGERHATCRLNTSFVDCKKEDTHCSPTQISILSHCSEKSLTRLSDFKQTIGIPMGRNCGLFLIDLFLYAYEAGFRQELLS